MVHLSLCHSDGGCKKLYPVSRGGGRKRFQTANLPFCSPQPPPIFNDWSLNTTEDHLIKKKCNGEAERRSKHAKCKNNTTITDISISM